MSKIYEALLRAEMDRISQLNGQQDTDAPISTQPANAGRDGRNASNGAGTKIEQPRSFGVERGLHDKILNVGNLRAAGGNGTASNGAASNGAAYAAATEPVHKAADPEVNNTTYGIEPEARLRQHTWHPDQLRLPALQSRGATVEQIRSLRARMHELRANHPLKTVLISSGLPEEGKSFIAANLAIGFANHRNSRVLLIDGDMRRGTLHKLLGTESSPGLTDYLSGAASLADVIQQPTLESIGEFKGLASLTFIPCGEDAENAADLSGNGRFDRLLQDVGDAFDWIVVDSSPVTLVADGANLARACDGVVLVARGGVTKYETAQRALHELKAARVLGVVLNAVQDAAPVGGYYGYDK